ncbi:MAG TPA: hypothetical protein DD405_00255 [Desulfobacteraceae bacterium]|nr:hypothetical protein [Desulfobacteraceae bacterium]
MHPVKVCITSYADLNGTYCYLLIYPEFFHICENHKPASKLTIPSFPNYILFYHLLFSKIYVTK